METNTRELTRAIASGNTEAFAQLYEFYFSAMLRDAMRFTGSDEQTCLDIVQDSMMKVIRCIKPMDTEAGLRAWLRCVVKSCAYDSLRREARMKRREQSRASEHSSVETSESDLTERLHWLQEQLKQLDPASRDIVMLRHRFGWTLQRIGSALGLSTGAVDGRVTRALSDLQHKAENYDD